MNQQDKIELSKRVAEKYGVEPWIDISPDSVKHTLLWLADDDARCFRLAVDNNLDVVCNNELVVEVFSLTGAFISNIQKYGDHLD